MGETFEDIINLIICDIFQSILDKINKSSYSIKNSAKYLSSAIKSNSLDSKYLNIITLISQHLGIIFGMTETDSLIAIFNLFDNVKTSSHYLDLVYIMRKSEIKLVEL